MVDLSPLDSPCLVPTTCILLPLAGLAELPGAGRLDRRMMDWKIGHGSGKAMEDMIAVLYNLSNNLRMPCP